MPRLSDASRLQRREAIAAAAMRCFARHGVAGTSMADIISEAGSSAGSVYSHFASKTELVRFTAQRALREIATNLGSGLPSERTPADVLTHLLRSNRDRTRAQTLLQIWAEAPRDAELADIARDSLFELRAQIRAALQPWWTSTDRSASADAITDAILTAGQGYIVRLTVDRDIDVDELASAVAATFEEP
jgi:AcrR family transcriptional regulator